MSESPGSRATLQTWRLILVFGLTAAAYLNTFSVPLVFDDVPTLRENASVQSLWTSLFPPPGLTVGGRPFLSFTFALNYAWGGEAVWSYHLVNLLIHLFAGLTLFAVVKATLTSAKLERRFESNADGLALVVSGWWMLHPLQTESVTYIVQRAESLMGLLYLSALYTFIRGVRNRQGATKWFALSVATTLLGIATKEVSATIPIMILLYDRTFVAGSFQKAWALRKFFYWALAVTWIPLGAWVASAQGRGGSAGFDTGISSWSYLLTQSRAIEVYLKLIAWPHPLILDYGQSIVVEFGAVAWHAILVIGLVVGTAATLVKKPTLGFLASWFFVILAPSSSFIPVATQTTAEHRIYLSLAAAITGMVLFADRWIAHARVKVAGATVILILSAFLVRERNRDYRSAVAIWTETVTYRPANARAHLALSVELGKLNHSAAAAEHLQRAYELDPEDANVNNAIGSVALQSGRTRDAIEKYEKALAINPLLAEAHNNLGSALAAENRINEARQHFEEALRLRPNYAGALNNYGQMLARFGDRNGAREKFDTALRYQSDFAEAENNLLALLIESNQLEAGELGYQRFIRKYPGFLLGRLNLAYIHERQLKLDLAEHEYMAAVQNAPELAASHLALGEFLSRHGETEKAVASLSRAVELNPEDLSTRAKYAAALLKTNHIESALREYRAIVTTEPQAPLWHVYFAIGLATNGQRTEAIKECEAALQLQPNFAPARQLLERLKI